MASFSLEIYLPRTCWSGIIFASMYCTKVAPFHEKHFGLRHANMASFLREAFFMLTWQPTPQAFFMLRSILGEDMLTWHQPRKAFFVLTWHHSHENLFLCVLAS